VTSPDLPAAPDPGAHLLDARGLRCPRPVLMLAAAINEVDPDAVVELWADDPAAKVDVPVWCRMRRQELQGLDEFDTAVRFRVRRSS
jgi:tRNA 2-thiouridine synthesizing protein A